MDIVAYWYRKDEEEATHDPASFKFVFKVRLYVKVDEADQAAVEMMFVQATEDVANNKCVLLSPA